MNQLVSHAGAIHDGGLVCPGCGLALTDGDLDESGYRCTRCGMEVAHLETTPLGVTRAVLGWVRRTGDVVAERYRIDKVLGKGGFAATYLVEDLRLNGRRRALKEIPESLYDATETQVLSRLSHPSIPDIIDRIHSDHMVYLVLELGGGRTLERERCRRGGRIPWMILCPWVHQLADALSYLHSQDPPIIHRDLKPDNILLDQHDRIMLIDFGIAKQVVDNGQTRTTARAATVGYSPPEQALGTGTEPRSDVYSLAATLYALLTGQVPPASHDRVAGKELVPPADLVPKLPRAINDAIVRGLSLNMAMRQATVQQLAQPFSLPRLTGGKNGSARMKVGSAWSDVTMWLARHWIPVGSVVLALAVVLAAGWLWHQTPTALANSGSPTGHHPTVGQKAGSGVGAEMAQPPGLEAAGPGPGAPDTARAGTEDALPVGSGPVVESTAGAGARTLVSSAGVTGPGPPKSDGQGVASSEEAQAGSGAAWSVTHTGSRQVK